MKPADGTGAEQLLLSSEATKYLNDWSPDGRLLLYHTSGGPGAQDIMALPMDGSGKPFPMVQTRFNEEGAQFSPDGRWLAYESNESGRAEIYVQPFPESGGKFQVSSAGGRHARWRRDGRELYYHGLDERLMAVSVQVSAAGAIEIGAPAVLFALPSDIPYFPSSDGGRFLTARPVESAAPAPLTVVLNWNPGPIR